MRTPGNVPPVPHLSVDLIDALTARFPLARTDWQMPVRQIDFKAGQQSIIEFLRTELLKQDAPRRISNVLRRPEDT